MPAAQKRLQTLVWILLAVVLSLLSRGVRGDRLVLPPGDTPTARTGDATWVSLDPDSLYHMRRIDRVLQGGRPVAETDGYLNYPEGAAIPWPPYYAWLASSVLGALAPARLDEPQVRRTWVETGAASLPLIFGVLTTLLVACAGFLLAGNTGAAVAGLTHALTTKAITYASLGNGDHHAWVSLCLALLATLFTLALQRGALERPRLALAFGVPLGAIAGLAIGTWVGALMYVVLVEVLLAVFIMAHSRHPNGAHPGLAPLGLAFHVSAIAVLAPAVLSSPWRAQSPWIVINLSWFHLAFLALGALVFLPLLLMGAGSRASRHYPWLVLGALASLAALCFALDLGPARGVREAFEWAGRGDRFMARVAESDPLWSLGASRIFAALGLGLALLPFAWVAALDATLRGRSPGLLPWVLWTPFLAYQAAGQQRFAEPLAIPLAVLLGWGVGALFGASGRERGDPSSRPTPARKALVGLAPLLGALLALALQAPSGKQTVERLLAARRNEELPVERLGLRAGVRLLCEWLRENTPADGEYSVMAFWHWGHFIEWAADRPSVATNFGSYVGRDSFLDPSRFFMSDDDAAAERMLENRAARYVLVTTHLMNGMKTLLQAVPEERWQDFVEVGPDGLESLGAQRPGLMRTVGARLSALELLAGREDYRPVPFLRLVHVSRARDLRAEMRAPGGNPIRMGSVWERVPGALLEAHGEPGTRLSARLWIEYPDAQFQILWRDSVRTDEQGVARLRVPYATDRAAGDGRARGSVKWSFGDESGERAIPESAVRSGRVLVVP